MAGLVLWLIPVSALAGDALAFARHAFETMQSIDPKSDDFSEKALAHFQGQFQFDTFAERVMQDFKTKLSAHELSELKTAFANVFFANFKKNASKITKRLLTNPTYQIEKGDALLQIARINGQSAKSQSPATIRFFISEPTPNLFKIVDIEIDSVLLSRNYRGALNRTFREKGFTGLLARLTEKFADISKKP